MSTQQNKEIFRRFIDEIWQKGDPDAARAIVARNVVVHGYPPEQSGPEGQLEAAGWFQAAFSNLRWMIEDVVAEDDRVVGRWTMRGTHTGPFSGVPPTGKSVEWTGIDFLRVQNGRIVDIWHNEDFYGLMRQIGGVPDPVETWS